MSEDPTLDFIKAYVQAASLQELTMVVLSMARSPELLISEYDRLNVGEVMAGGDWWSADLLRLIAKSDILHRMMLAVVFPSHVLAYEAWNASEEGKVE